MDATRVDRWIWAVRLVKTRGDAKALCDGGHVRVDGVSAKPATAIRTGDRVTARVGDRDRDLEVVTVIDRRVGASVAVTCYQDHSPPPPDRQWAPPVFARDRGTGRPTKRDRRVMDRYRQR